jgi:hypothetical protein
MISLSSNSSHWHLQTGLNKQYNNGVVKNMEKSFSEATENFSSNCTWNGQSYQKNISIQQVTINIQCRILIHNNDDKFVQ